MLQHTLREWKDKHFWILLFLSLVVLFCVYRITLPLPLFINVGTEGDERYLRDFNLGEQGEFYPFRWTRDSSYIEIPHLGSLPLEIVLAADAARPEGQPLPRVSLTANRTVLADFTMQNGIQAYQFLYHPSLFSLPKDFLLEVKSDTFAPPGDYRSLGILLNTVEVKPVLLPLRLLQVSLVASLMGALSVAFSYLLPRWSGVSQKKAIVCGVVVLALLGLGIVRQFIVARFLVGVFGLFLVGYVLAILLEAMGYREPLITRLGLGKKTLETWVGNLVSVIGNLYNSNEFLNKIASGIFDVLPAFLPAVVLFVLMPFALFLPNQDIFNNNLTLVIPYLVLAVMYFIFLIALSGVGQSFLMTSTVILLFYIGVYLGLSDIMAPVQVGQLMTGRETPNEPLFLTVVEVALAVVVIFCAIKLPWKHVKRFGSIFVLLLLISEPIVVFSGLAPETRLQSTNRIKNLSNPPEKLADKGNIYHLTFDAYSGAIFLENLEKMELTEEFDGFTFFEKNRSNYDWTDVSLASYMTGDLYTGNGNLKDWVRRDEYSGIINNLYNAGYEISVYIPVIRWLNNKASHVKIYEEVLIPYERLSIYCHFADLWLLRVVPNFLQQEVYRKGKGVFTRLFVIKDMPRGLDANPFASVKLLREIIEDEADRPDHGQYVYAHLFIPHGPHIMNRGCVFSPDDGSYEEQALCSTKLMAELISKLKELGRYDESTIIIHSDHGKGGSKNPDYGMSSEIEKKVDALNLRGLAASQINGRTHALLLIKPPSHSGKLLVISDRSTQLVDIPATIYDLLGLPVHTEEGLSVFSPDFPENREIHIFPGMLQLIQYLRSSITNEEQACHLSFTDGKGWKIYPNIHVRWE